MSGIVPRQRAAAPSAPGRIRGRTHLAGAILNSLRLARAGLVLAQHGVSFVPRGMKVPPALVAARLLTAPVPDTVWELKGTANWGASPLPLPFSRRGDASSLRRLLEGLIPRG